MFGQCFGHLFDDADIKDGMYVHALTTPNKPTTTSKFRRNTLDFKCVSTRNVQLNEAGERMNAMVVERRDLNEVGGQMTAAVIEPMEN